MYLKRLSALLFFSAIVTFSAPQRAIAVGVGNLTQAQGGTYYFQLPPGQYTITIGSALGNLDGALFDEEGNRLGISETRGEEKFQLSVSTSSGYFVRGFMSRCSPGSHTQNGCSAYIVIHNSAGDLIEIPILDIENERVISPSS